MIDSGVSVSSISMDLVFQLIGIAVGLYLLYLTIEFPVMSMAEKISCTYHHIFIRFQ